MTKRLGSFSLERNLKPLIYMKVQRENCSLIAYPKIGQIFLRCSSRLIDDPQTPLHGGGGTMTVTIDNKQITNGSIIK